MIQEIYSLIVGLLKLTFTGNVFWEVLPLVITTIVMVAYFEKYRNEMMGWNSYVANSLVLIFVSIALFKDIYILNGNGAGNYIDFPEKSIAVLFLLSIGLIIARLNFSHILPQKITSYISSPLTVNIIAYLVILYVHSNFKNEWKIFVALVVLFLALLLILNLIKIPLKKLFEYFDKLKKKEKVENIKEEKYQIKELKNELKTKEKTLKKMLVKDLDRQKKEASRLKKIILSR